MLSNANNLFVSAAVGESPVNCHEYRRFIPVILWGNPPMIEAAGDRVAAEMYMLPAASLLQEPKQAVFNDRGARSGK